MTSEQIYGFCVTYLAIGVTSDTERTHLLKLANVSCEVQQIRPVPSGLHQRTLLSDQWHRQPSVKRTARSEQPEEVLLEIWLSVPLALGEQLHTRKIQAVAKFPLCWKGEALQMPRVVRSLTLRTTDAHRLLSRKSNRSSCHDGTVSDLTSLHTFHK